ncbi:ComF family protein [Vibrio sp. RE86]|nr:phosphoribosyltransferase family protein [Vibrio sp. RE86]NOH80864.1 ComF family protein [Vibrio sp. RE86]
MLAQRVGKYIADLLPVDCELCRLPLNKEEGPFCHCCLEHFQPQPRCQRCGLPTAVNMAMCGLCLVKPPLWQGIYCVGDYQAPLSDYVHRLKYERQFWQATKLSQLLSPRIDHPADVVTSVPLHWARHWARGFNQSELIAIELAKQLNRPYQPLFRRTRATPQQKGLNKQQRQHNLDAAFELKSDISASHVAIVDDVLTTGSTVHHLCKLLLDAGVKTVDIYCICRTPEPSR